MARRFSLIYLTSPKKKKVFVLMLPTWTSEFFCQWQTTMACWFFWWPQGWALLPELRKVSKHLHGQLKFVKLVYTVCEGLSNTYNIQANTATAVSTGQHSWIWRTSFCPTDLGVPRGFYKSSCDLPDLPHFQWTS